jgi:hypothetical protein
MTKELIKHRCGGYGQGQYCGADPSKGELCRWIKQEGDTVNWTQPTLFDILEVTTKDKEQNATIHHTSN